MPTKAAGPLSKSEATPAELLGHGEHSNAPPAKRAFFYSLHDLRTISPCRPDKTVTRVNTGALKSTRRGKTCTRPGATPNGDTPRPFLINPTQQPES